MRKLEADIELTRKDIEEPTEVEVELKRRLSQMTDHLIQKQAKVCLSPILRIVLFFASYFNRLFRQIYCFA